MAEYGGGERKSTTQNWIGLYSCIRFSSRETVVVSVPVRYSLHTEECLMTGINTKLLNGKIHTSVGLDGSELLFIKHHSNLLD